MRGPHRQGKNLSPNVGCTLGLCASRPSTRSTTSCAARHAAWQVQQHSHLHLRSKESTTVPIHQVLREGASGHPSSIAIAGPCAFVTVGTLLATFPHVLFALACLVYSFSVPFHSCEHRPQPLGPMNPPTFTLANCKHTGSATHLFVRSLGSIFVSHHNPPFPLLLLSIFSFWTVAEVTAVQHMVPVLCCTFSRFSTSHFSSGSHTLHLDLTLTSTHSTPLFPFNPFFSSHFTVQDWHVQRKKHLPLQQRPCVRGPVKCGSSFKDKKDEACSLKLECTQESHMRELFPECHRDPRATYLYSSMPLSRACSELAF